MHHSELSLQQKAHERINCFLNVTIFVSDLDEEGAIYILGKQDPATRVFSSAQVWLLGCETVASQPLPQPSMLLELPTFASR